MKDSPLIVVYIPYSRYFTNCLGVYLVKTTFEILM